VFHWGTTTTPRRNLPRYLDSAGGVKYLEKLRVVEGTMIIVGFPKLFPIVSLTGGPTRKNTRRTDTPAKHTDKRTDKKNDDNGRGDDGRGKDR
jgi:hypothetical protein